MNIFFIKKNSFMIVSGLPYTKINIFAQFIPSLRAHPSRYESSVSNWAVNISILLLFSEPMWAFPIVSFFRPLVLPTTQESFSNRHTRTIYTKANALYIYKRNKTRNTTLLLEFVQSANGTFIVWCMRVCEWKSIFIKPNRIKWNYRAVEYARARG